ncbi:MAG: 50S ribosomal protein L25 [Verrucomicrobiota bacterium]|nr:50S ribosomal protein L25 [Verrucomicrobiota bacterium]
MEAVALNAQSRSELKRPRVKKLRASGQLPGVLYGCNQDSQPLSVCAKEFEKLVHHSPSENILVDLTLGEDRHLALVQEVQHHPLSGNPLHVDFRAVKEDQPVVFSVPIEPKGESYGVKNEGGLLEHVLFSIKVKALPKDLPEIIHVDVSEMRSGQTMHLGEIPIPGGLEVMGEKGIPAFSISIGRVARAEASQEKAAADANE